MFYKKYHAHLRLQNECAWYDYRMFQKFFLKQMLGNQLKSLPKDQQEKALAALDSNPEFFTNLINEISERLKRGEPQQAAIMSVVMAHKAELEKILKP